VAVEAGRVDRLRDGLRGPAGAPRQGHIRWSIQNDSVTVLLNKAAIGSYNPTPRTLA
jgi:hypothetical protein